MIYLPIKLMYNVPKMASFGSKFKWHPILSKTLTNNRHSDSKLHSCKIMPFYCQAHFNFRNSYMNTDLMLLSLFLAMERAITFLETRELPPHWDRDILNSHEEESTNNSTTASSESEELEGLYFRFLLKVILYEKIVIATTAAASKITW